MEIVLPTVVVIAGIDGAGKSTAAEALLAEFGVDTVTRMARHAPAPARACVSKPHPIPAG